MSRACVTTAAPTKPCPMAMPCLSGAPTCAACRLAELGGVGSTVRIRATGGQGRIGAASPSGQCRVDLSDGRWGWHYPAELDAIALDFAAEVQRLGRELAQARREECVLALRNAIEVRPDWSDVAGDARAAHDEEVSDAL